MSKVIRQLLTGFGFGFGVYYDLRLAESSQVKARANKVVVVATLLTDWMKK